MNAAVRCSDECCFALLRGIAAAHGPYYNLAGIKYMTVAADAAHSGSCPSIPAAVAHAEAAAKHSATLPPLEAALVSAMLDRCRGFASSIGGAFPSPRVHP